MKPYFQNDIVTIYHADCREALDGLDEVDYVLTDPPYALGSSRQEWKVTASVGTGIHLAAKKVKKGGAMFCFSAASGRGIDYTVGAVGSALALNRLLIWHKSFVRSRVAGPWRWDIVAILGFGRACFGRPEQSSVCTTSGPSTSKALGETGHPAEVPLEVAQWLFGPLDSEAVTLLDPFMGSGSLLIPAARIGRQVIGIESEEKYCEIAAKRLSATPCLFSQDEACQMATGKDVPDQPEPRIPGVGTAGAGAPVQPSGGTAPAAVQPDPGSTKAAGGVETRELVTNGNGKGRH